jgi:IS30 family transposase
VEMAIPLQILGTGFKPWRVYGLRRSAIAAACAVDVHDGLSWPNKFKVRAIGDWESDSVIGRGQKAAILTHVDRKSKYTKLAIFLDKSAASVRKACDASLLPIAHKIETVTYDNGKEFVGHTSIASSLPLQLHSLRDSESMGLHDLEAVDGGHRLRQR